MRPSLPAAARTTTPAACASAIASWTASSTAGNPVFSSWSKLRLMFSRSHPSWMPRRIAFTSPKLDPEFAVSSNTRYEKMSAPGAMPRIPVGGEPRPAIMPAKCVPCDPLGPNWFSGDPGTHPSPPATTRSGCPALLICVT